MFKQYRLKNYNFRLVLWVLALSILGILLVGSAEPSYMNKQFFGVLLGFTLMVIISMIDFSWILNFQWVIYALMLVLLLMVLVRGSSSHGATRWVSIFGIQFQPVEPVKVMLTMFFSRFFMDHESSLNSPKTFFQSLLLAFFPLVLVFSQPDLKNTLTLLVLFAILYYIAGISYKIIALIVLVVALLGGGLTAYILNTSTKPFFLRDYQWERVETFRDSGDSESDSDNTQQINSVTAIGSGELTGKGLNNDDPQSANNGNFIPEIENDFIFAVIGEELGFIGGAGIIMLLFLVVFECIQTGNRSKDLSGKLICCGIASVIGIQSFINIGVATMILPNTGTPLPFISYGLSSLVSCYIGIGFVLNVGLQSRIRISDVRSRADGRSSAA
ncbi:MAG: FtsW/RodA/SpoVE family cell cycle protein [Lachnospiraceae bacterium]|nr:FtsW/RodA/SpoVE family cell cycle protein [Lachnospiraceae bacterium]